MEGQNELITALISTASSSGVLAVVAKFIFGRMASEWKAIASSIKEISKELKEVADDLQEMKTKMAVHEVVAEEGRRMKSDVETMRREIIILQSQVQAAWRVIDGQRPQKS